jgi:hypothetical protein
MSPTLFATVYKRPAEGGLGLLLFAFGFCFGRLFRLGFGGPWLDSFVLGFLVWETFGGEKKRITEEKRTAKGKLLKGKEWLKRGCRKSAPRTLT